MVGLSDVAKNKLNELWTNPASPAAFTNPYALYREAVRSGLPVRLSQVIRFLQSSETYTTHRPVRTRFTHARLIGYGLDNVWEADTAHVVKLARQNSGIAFLLGNYPPPHPHAHIATFQSSWTP